MNYIRGLFQSDSLAVNRGVCRQRGEAIIHNERQTNFYRVSKARRDLSTRLFVSGQMLPVAVLGLLLGAVVPALGQSTFGSVRGIVQDNTSAVVSDTQVVLHSTDESAERTVIADTSGNFIFENVKAGKYTLHAHHDGFADTALTAITVEARQDLR